MRSEIYHSNEAFTLDFMHKYIKIKLIQRIRIATFFIEFHFQDFTFASWFHNDHAYFVNIRAVRKQFLTKFSEIVLNLDHWRSWLKYFSSTRPPPPSSSPPCFSIFWWEISLLCHDGKIEMFSKIESENVGYFTASLLELFFSKFGQIILVFISLLESQADK